MVGPEPLTVPLSIKSDGPTASSGPSTSSDGLGLAPFQTRSCACLDGVLFCLNLLYFWFQIVLLFVFVFLLFFDFSVFHFRFTYWFFTGWRIFSLLFSHF